MKPRSTLKAVRHSLHYPRQVALGAQDVLDGEAKTCHVLVTTRDHIVRLTLDERFFELPEHELKRRIGQALRSHS